MQRNVRVLQQFARRHSDGLRTTLQLSHLRPRDDLRSASVKDADVRHRQADPEILEHERKRGVEVKCLELQMQLEELELPEDEVHSQVDALRSKLLAMGAPARERGSIKKWVLCFLEFHCKLTGSPADTRRMIF